MLPAQVNFYVWLDPPVGMMLPRPGKSCLQTTANKPRFYSHCVTAPARLMSTNPASKAEANNLKYLSNDSVQGPVVNADYTAARQGPHFARFEPHPTGKIILTMRGTVAALERDLITTGPEGESQRRRLCIWFAGIWIQLR